MKKIIGYILSAGVISCINNRYRFVTRLKEEP